MKAFIKKVTPKERKALKPFVDRLEAGRQMMKDGALMVNRAERELWDNINALYPLKLVQDKSFDTDEYEISGFEVSKAVERFCSLKKQALKDKDFEAAAKYRDQERAEKEKEARKDLADKK